MNRFKSLVMSKAGTQLVQLQKHSPKLLFAAGVVGFAATVVLAARATLKVEDVLDQHTTDLNKIDSARDTLNNDYSDSDAQRDTVVVFTKTALSLAKLYGPSVLVGAASIAALTGSHVILSNRVSGLSAAYAALDKGFRLYRERVVAEYGEQKDVELRHGVEEFTIVDETEEGPVTKSMKRPAGKSIYSRWFDEGSENWNRHPMSNVVFLRSQERWANDLLNAHGYLFLNDVYKMLGLPISPEGQLVGWVKGNGDNFVSFGFFENDQYTMHRFVQGEAPGIHLDFNVDGVVYDLVGKKDK